MSVPFIGSTISLISKSEVRYVGQLAQIDQLKSTVTLQNVRSYGSEGRRLASTGLPEIPASPNVFEFIEFRGADIKDLSVVELQQPPASAPAPPVDPAIVSLAVQQQQQQHHHHQQQQQQSQQPTPPQSQQTRQQSVVVSGSSSAAVAPPVKPSVPFPPAVGKPAATHQPKEKQQPQQQQQQRSDDQQRHRQRSQEHPKQQAQPQQAKRGGGGNRGRGASNNANNGAGQQQRAPRLEVPKTDFDFATANAKLDKQEIAKQLLQKVQGPAASKSNSNRVMEEQTAKLNSTTLDFPDSSTFYDKKSSFFDDISCEAKDRVAAVDNPLGYDERRARMAEDRKTNLETFGVAGTFHNRRGWRGRGRGNRGRGSRGRGGRGANSNFNPASSSSDAVYTKNGNAARIGTADGTLA